MTRYSRSILNGEEMSVSENPKQFKRQEMLLFSMDDLVFTGVLGLIGIYLALFLLLVAIYSVGRLMYTALSAGDAGLVLGGAVAILISVSLYLATGFWLRKTDRI